jgi:small neutral amino acid transporter SnatA (MarC family)
MKISEILKGLVMVVKYIVAFYLLLNVVAYIYIFISQPKGTSFSRRQEMAWEFIIMGNALLYMFLTDIFYRSSILKKSTGVLPYNSISSIHHTNAY